MAAGRETNQKRMTLNSVIVPEFGLHLLSFRQLHSYLSYKGLAERFDIRFNAFTTDTPNASIAEDILGQNGDIAAFSVYSWNAEKIKDITRRIKAADRGTYIVCGGPYAAALPRDFLAESGSDMIVKGEGEDVFYHVLQKILEGNTDFHDIPNLVYRTEGDVVETLENHYFDIEQQDYPIVIEPDGAPIFTYETSRGCPFKCRFCCWDVSQKAVRFFPDEKIERDLKAILDLPYVENLYLCDSDLFLKKSRGLWVLRLFSQLNEDRKAKGLKPVNISFETNLQYADEDVIEALLKLPAGQNFISCGLQTVDETVSSEHLSRPFNEKKYTGNLLRILERAKEVGRYDDMKNSIKLEIIYGLPGDCYEGFERTFDYVLSELGFNAFFSIRFEMLPGSYFWDHADDYRLSYCEKAPHYLLSSSTFSERDMERAVQLVFYHHLFTTVLRGISRAVDKNVRKNKLDVYKKIIRHIEDEYPEFVSTLYGYFDPVYIESGFRDKIEAYMLDRKHVELRYKIIREAREIVVGGSN